MPIKIEGHSDNLFLVIMIYHQPRPPTAQLPGVRTESKDWTQSPSNWIDIEVPAITTRINAKKLSEASVIIDIKQKKLVKNRFSNNDPDDIYRHFMKKYGNRIPTYEAEIG